MMADSGFRLGNLHIRNIGFHILTSCIPYSQDVEFFFIVLLLLLLLFIVTSDPYPSTTDTKFLRQIFSWVLDLRLSHMGDTNYTKYT
jgi:hypothetical protein